MSAEYTNNHYVPQWYQRQFIEAERTDRELYLLDLKPDSFRDGKGVRRQRKALRRNDPPRKPGGLPDRDHVPALLDAAIDRARQRGCSVLRIDSFEWADLNDALSTRGFVPHARPPARLRAAPPLNRDLGRGCSGLCNSLHAEPSS